MNSMLQIGDLSQGFWIARNPESGLRGLEVVGGWRLYILKPKP